MSGHCKRPPMGWVCYLERGHDDPCPTYPRWWNLPAQIACWRFARESRR